ncbi:secondary thiamine-phosphate synthase enzyme YjbQ [Hyphomicrobium sp.]|uniref:secondary thiamine-phosphate synthase enzyme YjbQ n=1 Tax=Hyphomicrobium sp. TaxID=82 RepID=UPI001D76BAFA|nr:secondary thiamine-phosphate synthase enzyme YjbQ [Hyphomicrobium sp.]MBY0559307.1 secondary thiamine-phosphate synthase enzyme YjbQ [Hyphomicrobium sp.]
MRQHQETLEIRTNGPGLVEFTEAAARVVEEAGILTGLAHLFCRHTSASLLIQENADPDVQLDLAAFFRRLVPDGDPLFLHQSEGPDDMAAHVKSALTQTTLAIPIADGRMLLGTWQGIYLFEHRRRPHTRQVVIHVLGS